MKTKLLLLVILCLATAAIYAQHDYSQDVIVLFKEGMKSDKAITKGEISIFESNKLKSFFQRKPLQNHEKFCEMPKPRSGYTKNCEIST